MAAMYNPPLILVAVGITKDGGERKVKYAITGTDHMAISRALEMLGFVFDHKVQANGELVFRGPNGSRAWYTQVQDHNPKETPTP